MSVTLLPQPAERIETDRYVTLGMLQVFDVATTAVILAVFVQAVEGNPLAKWVLDHGTVGLLAMLGFKLGAVAFAWWCQTPVRLVAAIYTLVIVNNLVVLYLLGASL